MDWTQFLIMLTTMVALFMTIIGLFFWNRSESRTDARQMFCIIQSIQAEIKDFHGRLERQDAEFKAHLMHMHKD